MKPQQLRTFRQSMLAMVLILAVQVSGRAAIIFSNLGAGDSFDVVVGYAVNDFQDVAMPFKVLGADHTFKSVEMALTNETSDPLTIHLMTDAGGAPNAIIESITIAVPTGPSLVAAISTLMPTLTAGTTYWIATNAMGDYEGGWNFTDPVVSGPVAGRTNISPSWASFPNEVSSAFRVNGDLVAAVPEPASLALWSLGALGCAVAGYRRRKLAA